MPTLPWRWIFFGGFTGSIFGIDLAMTTAWQMLASLADFGAHEATSAALTLSLPYHDRVTAWVSLGVAPVVAAINHGWLLPRLTQRIGWWSLAVILTRSLWPPMVAALSAQVLLILGTVGSVAISSDGPPRLFAYAWVVGTIALLWVTGTTGHLLLRARPCFRKAVPSRA